MGHILLRLIVISLGFFPVVLGGCVNLGKGTQQTTKFYVLHSLYSAQEDTQTPKVKSDLVVGVGPVQLPQYVNRPQIVTRTGRNELEVAPFARWGEPLEENYSRVLAENLTTIRKQLLLFVLFANFGRFSKSISIKSHILAFFAHTYPFFFFLVFNYFL